MAEKEYIEREAILACYQMDDHVLNEVGHVPLPIIRQNIMDIPAADVAPVKRGRWIHDINNLYGCSECMERETMSPKRLKRFCPNCGADMRERKDGDG